MLNVFEHILFVNPGSLLLVAAFFVSVTIAVIIYISAYMARRARRKSSQGNWKNIFSEFISELAIVEDAGEMHALLMQPSAIAICELLDKDDRAKKVMGRQLLHASRQLAGSALTNIISYYNTINLGAHALHRLQKGKWYVKAAAMQELAQLSQSSYITRIYRYTDHPNELVRSEARIAVVKLTGVAGLRFLDIISRPLSEWEQLGLLHELSKTECGEFSRMQNWLMSANTSVVEFALRLMKVYRVEVPTVVLEKCLAHSEKPIRHRTIQAIAEIPDNSLTDILMKRFQVEISVDSQLLILQALQVNTSQFSRSFLLDALQHPDASLKLAVARIIRDNEPDTWRNLPAYVNVADYPWNQIFPILQKENAA